MTRPFLPPWLIPWAVLGLVSTALGLWGLIYVVFVRPVQNRPELAAPILPTIEAYLDAVADGDATGALAMTQVDKRTHHGVSTSLLDDEVLHGAQERITDPHVVAVETSWPEGDMAKSTIAYTLAGEQHEVALYWDYDEDTQEWKVDNGLISVLHVSGSSDQAIPIEVAGVTPAPAFECREECMASPTYALFAGVYQVRADLSGFEIDPKNDLAAEQLVAIAPGEWAPNLYYRVLPLGEPWPTSNGNPMDPSPDETEG